MQRIIEATADGLPTLYLPHLDEHYHSTKGALTEAQHVYIESAFRHRNHPHGRLLEMGFGTGLNAFLTLLAAQESGTRVHYTTLERYPVPPEVVEQLAYAQHIAPEAAHLFRALHEAAWNEVVEITPTFTLEKLQVDLLTFSPSEGYDTLYYDAFAPEKQPELWSEEVMARLYHFMNGGGVLTTYCAKGAIRRSLQAAGFVVERLAGPPQGKREILRATKPL